MSHGKDWGRRYGSDRASKDGLKEFAWVAICRKFAIQCLRKYRPLQFRIQTMSNTVGTISTPSACPLSDTHPLMINILNAVSFRKRTELILRHCFHVAAWVMVSQFSFLVLLQLHGRNALWTHVHGVSVCLDRMHASAKRRILTSCTEIFTGTVLTAFFSITQARGPRSSVQSLFLLQ